MNAPNHLNCSETETHQFWTEASSLGLAPGSFPMTMETTMGNGQPFQLLRTEEDGNVLIYRQALGCIILRVFND